MRTRKIAALLGVRTRQQRYLDRLRTQGSYCFIHINKCGGTSVEQALGLPRIHDTALQRIARIGRARWDSLFSFAVIRHPYDKVRSHFKYRVRTNQTGLGDRHIGFNEWVVQAYGCKNPRYYDKPLMFQPCLDWLVDETGKVVVNRTIKLEEIDVHWPALCRTVLGDSVDLGRHNTTTPGGRSREYDLSSDAIAILNGHFARDFDYFGYKRRSA